jgi:hypothetical protein
MLIEGTTKQKSIILDRNTPIEISEEEDLIISDDFEDEELDLSRSIILEIFFKEKDLSHDIPE